MADDTSRPWKGKGVRQGGGGGGGGSGGGGSSSNAGGSFNWRRSTPIIPSTSSGAKKLERLERFGPTAGGGSGGGGGGSWRRSAPPSGPANIATAATAIGSGVEDFGFVSKGDGRLKDFHNQELFHKHISKKYLEFCGTSASSDQLESEFAELAITPLNNPRSTARTGTATVTAAAAAGATGAPAAGSKNVVYNDARNAELSSILLGMRKLREGITAARRVDRFAVEVFKQHIRAAILVQQIDNYHSALTYLLYELHVFAPLSALDVQEFASYHMLHLAACLAEYGAALAVRNEFQVVDRRALQAVHAIIHGNYWSFRAARNRVDQYMGRLMDYAEERMRQLALKCVGLSYFTVDLPYLEVVSGLPWRRLQDEYRVGWQLDEATRTVTVKRPKMKAGPAPALSR